MLSKIVQPRKSPVAVALKRTFARMFPYMASQVLAPGEAEVTGRIARAEKPLTFFLSRGRVCLARLGIVVRTRDIIVIIVHIHGRGYCLFTISSFRGLMIASLCASTR
jgi:hypothetical protein